MKITWLGQAGLLFETEDLCVMIDPYFSNSVERINPAAYRRVPIEERFFSLTPDVLVFTHDHLDHYDPETVTSFLGEKTGVTVLSPRSVWERVRAIGGNNQYVLFDRGTSRTEGGIRFTAIPAAHSDPYAIGVLVDDGTHRYYVTGDTLYHEDIFPALPPHMDAVFLPINGVGNNMNMADAAAFASRIGARAVPLHCGMLDDIDMHAWTYKNKIVPTIYEEIEV